MLIFAWELGAMSVSTASAEMWVGEGKWHVEISGKRRADAVSILESPRTRRIYPYAHYSRNLSSPPPQLRRPTDFEIAADSSLVGSCSSLVGFGFCGLLLQRAVEEECIDESDDTDRENS